MEKNIIDFLKNCGFEELKNRKIINTTRNLLNSDSVRPLVTFMKERKISKLTYHKNGILHWFLQTDSMFLNKFDSKYSFPKSARDLQRNGRPIGDIFLHANPEINPYFYMSDAKKRTSSDDFWEN
jgi:hypothetical protein